MNGNELLDKMELIDPAYVEAADAQPRRKRNGWIKWGAAAACLCVVTAITLAVVGRPEQQPSEPMHMGTTAPPSTEAPTERPTETAETQPDSVRLEILQIPELYAGFGFGGFSVNDISEYRSGNPWSPDMELTTLPVYKNSAYDPTRAGVPRGLTEAEMQERLTNLTERLGLTLLSSETQWDEVYLQRDDTEKQRLPISIEAQTDGGTLRIFADGDTTYFPSDDRTALPDEYRFTESSTTHDEAMATLAYLAETYNSLFGFKDPVSVTCCTYGVQGEMSRSYGLYDAGSSAEEAILNYNFRCVTFESDEYDLEKEHRDEAGGLYAIRLPYGEILGEKLGDYPIITAEEATELLLSGYGQSSVPQEYPAPTAETVDHVELVYRQGPSEELLLPYYRFDVRLPDGTISKVSGMKDYGVYYVPAVAAEYVADMPTYDGWFAG